MEQNDTLPKKSYVIGRFEHAITYFRVYADDYATALRDFFNGAGELIHVEPIGEPEEGAGLRIENLDPTTRDRLVREGVVRPEDRVLRKIASITED